VLWITLVLVASFWLVPKFLNQLIWKPVAYALPVFFLIFIKFWFPSLYAEKFWTMKLPILTEPAEIKTRRKNLIKWTLISLVIAVLVGVAAYFLPVK
jgi:hypothetical protein